MELKFQNDKSQRIWIKNWQRKIIREINYEIYQTNFLLGIDERPTMILSLCYIMRRKSGGRGIFWYSFFSSLTTMEKWVLSELPSDLSMVQREGKWGEGEIG